MIRSGALKVCKNAPVSALLGGALERLWRPSAAHAPTDARAAAAEAAQVVSQLDALLATLHGVAVTVRAAATSRMHVGLRDAIVDAVVVVNGVPPSLAAALAATRRPPLAPAWLDALPVGPASGAVDVWATAERRVHRAVDAASGENGHAGAPSSPNVDMGNPSSSYRR